MHVSWSCFSVQRFELNIVDIGEILDHHWLNLIFIKKIMILENLQDQYQHGPRLCLSGFDYNDKSVVWYV